MRSVNVILVEPDVLYSIDISRALLAAGHRVAATATTRRDADNLIPLLLYLQADIIILCGNLGKRTSGKDGWELSLAMVEEAGQLEIIDHSVEPYGYADYFVERYTPGCIERLCNLVTVLSEKIAKTFPS